MNFVFLSYNRKCCTSTDPGRITPSSLDENSEEKDTKKGKEKADNNNDDQTSRCVKSVRIRRSLRIQSECGKIRTRITPNTDTFYAVTFSAKEAARKSSGPRGRKNTVF